MSRQHKWGEDGKGGEVLLGFRGEDEEIEAGAAASLLLAMPVPGCEEEREAERESVAAVVS